MQQSKNPNVTKDTKKTTQHSAVRVTSQVQKRLTILLTKANKKNFGKKIKTGDLLEVAINLIKEEHIALLQQKSLSNADLLEIKYRDYIKKKGKISKDEFLGILLSQNETNVA